MNQGVVAGVALMAVLAVGARAEAQGFGLGPRWSFIRGDAPTGTPSTRMLGGTIRIPSSKRVVLEVAADYRSQTGEDGLTRLRERPIQGSLLLFPVRSTFAPYLLGGYGLYTQTMDVLDATGAVSASTSARKTGAHIGFGAELFISRHAAFFLDYRYRFVKFGVPDEGADTINIPGSGLIPGDRKLSHEGTMWTSGVAFYF